MRLIAFVASLTLSLLLFGAGVGAATDGANFFASIYIDGDKVGQIHLTELPDKGEKIDELKSNASMSVLGIDVFHFQQSLHETWENGALEALKVRTDDDGTTYDVELKRTNDGYSAKVNGKAVDVPLSAYPSSFWRHAITKADLIFDTKDLSVYKVSVARKPDTIRIGGKDIATDRYDFSGGWTASIWFDADDLLIQFESEVRGHSLKVVRDP